MGTVQKHANSTRDIHQKQQVNVSMFKRRNKNNKKSNNSKLQSYSYRKTPMTESTRSSKAPLLGILSSNALKTKKKNDKRENEKENESYYHGKCNQSGCPCSRFVECSSKWSKGKCKYCNHKKEHHKKMKLKS